MNKEENNYLKKIIDKANNKRLQKDKCCICNPQSEFDYLCENCLKHGWRLQKIKREVKK